MNKDDRTAVIAVPVAIAIGAGLALAGSVNGIVFQTVPVMLLIVGGVFVLQWIAFIPAFLFKTEKFYDLTGSLTYLASAASAILLQPGADARGIIIACCVAVWALRLGYFLFVRVLRAGEDSRFANLRGNFVRFLMAWTLQGLWVTFSMAAGLAAMTSQKQLPLDIFAAAGLVIWIAGFLIEGIADAQKGAFRSVPANRGKFISTGLWSWSRHPNYFGEIVLWTGIAVIAFPVLEGWQLITLVSPVFVAILLTRISGIPLLEEAADKKWGGQPEYEEYKKNTSVLVLWPRKRG